MGDIRELFCSVCGLIYGFPLDVELRVRHGGPLTKREHWFCSVECARTGALAYSQEKLVKTINTLIKNVLELKEKT